MLAPTRLLSSLQLSGPLPTRNVTVTDYHSTLTAPFWTSGIGAGGPMNEWRPILELLEWPYRRASALSVKSSGVLITSSIHPQSRSPSSNLAQPTPKATRAAAAKPFGSHSTRPPAKNQPIADADLSVSSRQLRGYRRVARPPAVPEPSVSSTLCTVLKRHRDPPTFHQSCATRPTSTSALEILRAHAAQAHFSFLGDARDQDRRLLGQTPPLRLPTLILPLPWKFVANTVPCALRPPCSPVLDDDLLPFASAFVPGVGGNFHTSGIESTLRLACLNSSRSLDPRILGYCKRVCARELMQLPFVSGVHPKSSMARRLYLGARDLVPPPPQAFSLPAVLLHEHPGTRNLRQPRPRSFFHRPPPPIGAHPYVEPQLPSECSGVEKPKAKALLLPFAHEDDRELKIIRILLRAPLSSTSPLPSTHALALELDKDDLLDIRAAANQLSTKREALHGHRT
ncbi:hypothetical protein C8R45DRAFT_1221152 [Mycena sanguinolenta]|nr:hypothetical protein C8R45DRAFT_1221152 [Mycena sanguinolenta]